MTRRKRDNKLRAGSLPESEVPTAIAGSAAANEHDGASGLAEASESWGYRDLRRLRPDNDIPRYGLFSPGPIGGRG